MSEYQYYEFLSIDQALAHRQMRELRAVSSRAEITPTRFTNFYDYGDFKGVPSRWMERYFDAFLYFANWGTRFVSLRVPREFLDLATARTYCRTPSASARLSGRWLILDFASEREDDGLAAPEGALGTIVPVRADLLGADLRLLYLGWLLSVQAEEANLKSPPPCPPGMRELTGSLAAFAEFMGISPELIAYAARRSRQVSDERVAFRRWAKALPQRRLAQWLERLAFPRGPHARAELLREFRQRDARVDRATKAGTPRRASRTARGTAARPRR
jgi:hypothetical protein